ncbi:MAG: hypothetical protein ACLRZG_00060 [Streptococcus sp.]
MMSLKLFRNWGYKTIYGNMESTMYSDGKDEYVRVKVTDKESILF